MRLVRIQMYKKNAKAGAFVLKKVWRGSEFNEVRVRGKKYF